MKWLAFLIVGVFGLSTISMARDSRARANLNYRRKAIPLMPPRWELASYSSPAVTAEVRSTPETPVDLGVEFGLLGRRTTSDGTLGMDLMPGFRLFSEFAAIDRITLRPSVGYFFRSTGEAGVSVFENLLEGGLSALWTFTDGPRVGFAAGFAQRVDMNWARTTLPGSVRNSATAFYYRVGPQARLNLALNDAWRLSSSFETTFVMNDGGRPFVGLSLGISYFGW